MNGTAVTLELGHPFFEQHKPFFVAPELDVDRAGLVMEGAKNFGLHFAHLFDKVVRLLTHVGSQLGSKLGSQLKEVLLGRWGFVFLHFLMLPRVRPNVDPGYSEKGALESYPRTVPSRFHALLVEGVPGIGKSTPIDALIRRHISNAGARKIRAFLHLPQDA